MQLFLLLSSIQVLFAEEIPEREWSLTIDSMQAAQNKLQIQQEWALSSRLGLGFSEGFGFHENETSYQLGILSRYYLLGNFMGGVAAGGDLSYTTYLLRDAQNKTNGHLLAPSVLLTGKYIFDVGLTIEPSIGRQFATLWATAPTQDAVVSESEWRWVFGLRLGWSIEPWSLHNIWKEWKPIEAE